MFRAAQIQVLQCVFQAMECALCQCEIVVTELECGEFCESVEGVVGNLFDVILGEVEEVEHFEGFEGAIGDGSEEVLLQIQVLQVLLLTVECSYVDLFDVAVAQLDIVQAQVGKDVVFEAVQGGVVDVQQVDGLGLGEGVEGGEECWKVRLAGVGEGIESETGGGVENLFLIFLLFQ